ncbi:tripartite motif-containing protein 52-like [Amblyraja radiata]|uniref:tripartite motif-containing protein 52-like n=1 Tax=Amblyraja radiata TaxID=386614 RepID=UPI001402723B|nr:tripartite motif-containing protein 52-like [Amblyraja radiata]
MASTQQIESLTEDLICPICLNIFTDPVSPKCGHNFCRSCIAQSWEREGKNSCPKCREEFPDRTLIVNWALSSLAQKTHQLNLNQKEKESKLHCEEHQEELKVFCETDKKLICLICRDGREHKTHRFIRIEEAVENYKAQSRSLQSHITSHFNKKRQILAEEEQHLLKDLREVEAKSLDIMEKNLQTDLPPTPAANAIPSTHHASRLGCQHHPGSHSFLGRFQALTAAITADPTCTLADHGP